MKTPEHDAYSHKAKWVQPNEVPSANTTMKTPTPGNNRSVMYIHSDALTICDCNKELILSQNVYGDKTYRGNCICGMKWELLNNKLIDIK